MLKDAREVEERCGIRLERSPNFRNLQAEYRKVPFRSTGYLACTGSGLVSIGQFLTSLDAPLTFIAGLSTQVLFELATIGNCTPWLLPLKLEIISRNDSLDFSWVVPARVCLRASMWTKSLCSLIMGLFCRMRRGMGVLVGWFVCVICVCDLPKPFLTSPFKQFLDRSR
jgi:hypothetical protein